MTENIFSVEEHPLGLSVSLASVNWRQWSCKRCNPVSFGQIDRTGNISHAWCITRMRTQPESQVNIPVYSLMCLLHWVDRLFMPLKSPVTEWTDYLHQLLPSLIILWYLPVLWRVLGSCPISRTPFVLDISPLFMVSTSSPQNTLSWWLINQ